jgi:hypothetical protein
MIFESLRDEIIESQKARTDLIKWKLLLVAAIGAAGVQSSSGRPSPLLLTLVPFVCLYADTVCFHNDIRIMAIARFLRTRPIDDGPSPLVAYEQYCTANRASFSLESFALQGSTLALSFLVLLLGLNFDDPVIADWFQGPPGAVARVGFFLSLAGGSGLALGWIFHRLYKHKMNTLDGRRGWWLAIWARKLMPGKPER